MSTNKCLKKILKLFGEYKRNIIIILICLTVSSVINLFIPLMNKEIMDNGFVKGDMKILSIFSILLLALYVFNELVDILKEKRRVKISTNLQYKLTYEFFQHLTKIKIGYFDNENHVEILNRIDIDISNVVTIADERLFFVITKIFGMIGGMIGLSLLNFRLTLLVLILIPIKLFIMRYFAKERKKLTISFMDKNRAFSAWFGNCLGGMREIRLFGIVKEKIAELSLLQKDIAKISKDINMMGQYNGATNTLLVQLLSFAIYIIGGYLVTDGNLTIGGIFAFISYSVYVTDPIAAILNIGYLLAGIMPSAKRYFEFMEIEKEDENGRELENTDKGNVEFNNVSFKYESEQNIFNKLNFEIFEGSKIAIIGKNGTGKSTIIGLLLRMYKPTGGKITIRNRDIEEYTIESWRKLFSVVSQQTYLFNDTIRNNIRLYKNIAESELNEICKICDLKELIREKGLEYNVGENGIKLSGGQRQKIAWARALIEDRPFLILDEATSNTDVFADSMINTLIRTKLKDKTVIIITHRYDTLMEMDNILFLREGGIYESGKYSELKKTSVDFQDSIRAYNFTQKSKK